MALQEEKHSLINLVYCSTARYPGRNNSLSEGFVLRGGETRPASWTCKNEPWNTLNLVISSLIWLLARPEVEFDCPTLWRSAFVYLQWIVGTQQLLPF